MAESLHFTLILSLTVVIGLWVCSGQVRTQIAQVRQAPDSVVASPAQDPNSAASKTRPNSGEEGSIVAAFVKADKLSYSGYVIQKRHKKVTIDYPKEMKEPPLWVEVSYAVLKRNGKALLKFDGIYSGWGNSTRFGLFPLLGGKTKQLVVSQDVFRGGNQWIVSLSPRSHIIYDGSWFSTGREADDMGVVDIDHDGVYEITAPITDFYELQDKLSMSQIPLPEIIFKYDAHKGKYFPNNPLFASYLINGVDISEKGLGRNDQFALRSTVLHKLLTYIYVGREKEAWAFYDREYKLDDKDEMKRRVKSILCNQAVYKFIYKYGSYK